MKQNSGSQNERFRKMMNEALRGPQWADCIVELCQDEAPSQSWWIVFSDGKRMELPDLQCAANFLSQCQYMRIDDKNSRRLVVRCPIEYYEDAE